MKKILIFVFLFFISAVSCRATTRTAASCAVSDVQAQVNLSANGDTVIIPTCTSTTPGGTNTWNTTLTINVAITLQGQDSPGGTGGGSGQTVIIDNMGPPNPSTPCQPAPLPLISVVTGSATNLSRITGITINGDVNAQDTGGCAPGTGHIVLSGQDHSVRIDHITFSITKVGIVSTDVWGVLDHNVFSLASVSGNGAKRGIYIQHPSWLGSGSFGDNSWFQQDTMGMPGTISNPGSGFPGAAMYVEANQFNVGVGTDSVGTVACDAGGSRCVERFNTGYAFVGTHGLDTTARTRSVRHLEFYNNAMNDNGQLVNLLGTLRGGTAMFFNNTISQTNSSSYSTNFSLHTYRRLGSYVPWGNCGAQAPFDNNSPSNPIFSGTITTGGSGTITASGASFPGGLANHIPAYSIYDVNTGIAGVISSNTSTTISWQNFGAGPFTFNTNDTYNVTQVTCADQPGSGAGLLVTGAPPVLQSTGNPGSVNQVRDPVYGWGNSCLTSFPSSICTTTGPKQALSSYYLDLNPNTDFYDYNSGCAPNGCAGPLTTGVGIGTLAQRPAGCTKGVGYWANDQGNWNLSGSGGQGELFVCTSTNTWQLYYEPYTYPHPLTLANPLAATPQFTPLPGGYTDTTVSRPPNTSLPNFPWGSTTITPTVTIMDNTPSATICYTTNGTTPTATTPGTCDALAGEVSVPAGSYPCATTSSASGCAGSATGYSQFQVSQSALAAVPINHVNTTVKAIATEVGYTNSSVNTATYVIDSACTAPTITSTPTVTATTGLDSALVPPVNDGLTFITLSFTTSIPTNAQYEIGGINVHTPYTVSPLQDTAGATSHSFTFTGLLPAVINWGYGVTASTVIQSGANTGQVCGSGSQAVFTPAYTSGSGSILAATAARADTTTSPATSYKVFPHGSHHVTAGYSTYFAVDFTMIAGINPPNGSLTMTITGEPTTGTKFNWMSAGIKTGACTNQGILSSDGGDVLSQTNVCNDTNKLNVFIAGSLPGREIQFVTSPSTPPGTYNLNLTMSNTVGAPVNGCTAACNTAASTTWQIIVDPPTAPFGVSSTTFPKQAPASFPAIPNQVVYTNRITEFGQNYLNCAQDGTTNNNIIRPNDNSTLLTIGPAGQQASWYYDGVNAWFTADSLRQNWAGDGPAGTMLSWSQCRQDQVEMYRDNGVLAGFGGFTNQTFSQGYHDDYQIGGGLGGKALDLQEVTTMVTTPQSPLGPANANYMDIDLRAIGYNMRSYIHGVHLGLDQPQTISAISGTGATGPFTLTFTTPLFNTTPPGYWPFAKKGTASQPMVVSGATGTATVYNTTWLTDQNAGTQATASFQVVANMPVCSANCGTASISPTSTGYSQNSQGVTATPMRAFLDYNLDHVLAQMEQACITQDPTQQNWELFFLGTSARELIEYYNLITPDPRIPPIVKTCADFLWTQFQKQPTNVGTWFYVQATQFENANLQTQGGTNCNSPEDALNVPLYAWLYNYYGLPIYQQEGDYLFGLNATFSTGNDVLANGIFAQLPGGCYNYDGPHSIMGIGGGPTGKNFSQGLYWGPQLNYVTARNPQFNIFPGSVGVFNVTQGTSSTAQIITLSNPVNPGVAASKVIGNATITGTDAARFTLTQTGCGNTTLNVGSTCTMSVVFSPTAGTTVVTAYGGTPIAPNTFLNIPVGASTYKVPLYGTGVNGYTTQPTLNPIPGSYGGTQNVQFTSQPGAQICLATSNGNLSTGNGNIVGTGGGTCFNGITSIPSISTTPVSTNTTFIRTVATAPGYANSVGLPSQTFTITSVPTTTVTPNPLNFPSTNVNTTSAARTVTITNTGSAPVIVTQAQVFATVFTLVNGTCFTQFGSNTSFTLPVGGSCTWGITFTPTATISYVGGCPSTNCFSVTDNAQGSPQTVNLNGTGTQATIVWSSPQGGTTYNYGNIVVGTFTDSNPLTLQNTGTGPLNVVVSLSGTGYSITSSNCPGVLQAGNSCTYVIRFTPPSVASFPGSLTETDSLASNSPQSLTLAGAGVNPPTQQVAPAPWVIIARRKGR